MLEHLFNTMMLFLGGILFGIGEGTTEAMTWNMHYKTPGRILSNLASNSTSKIYHSFRLIEILGMILMIYSIRILEISLIAFIFDMIIYVIFTQGMYRLSFIYERKQKLFERFAKAEFDFKWFNGKTIVVGNLSSKVRFIIWIISALLFVSKIHYQLIQYLTTTTA